MSFLDKLAFENLKYLGIIVRFPVFQKCRALEIRGSSGYGKTTQRELRVYILLPYIEDVCSPCF